MRKLLWLKWLLPLTIIFSLSACYHNPQPGEVYMNGKLSSTGKTDYESAKQIKAPFFYADV